MVQVQKLAAFMLIVQGVAYTFAAIMIFDRLSLDVLRFAGTGLGWIFLALLNLSSVINGNKKAFRITFCANCLALLYFVLLAVSSPGWKSAIAILLILACFAGSVKTVLQSETSNKKR